MKSFLNSRKSKVEGIKYLSVLVFAGAALTIPFGSGMGLAAMPLMGLLDPRNGFRFEEPADQGGDGSSEPSGGGDSSGPLPTGSRSGDGGGETAAGETSGESGGEMSMDDLAAMTDEASDDGSFEPEEDSKRETPAGKGEMPDGEASDGEEADGSGETSNVESQTGDEGVEYAEGFDPNDTIEIDGQEYFFHPDEHAPEGSTQANAYPTRDATEEAWPHKIGTIKEKMESLHEKGRDIGAVDLPDWFPDPDDPEALDDIMDIENPIGWTNEELRKKAGEADKLISYLDERDQRVTQEYEQSQQVEELEQETKEVNQQLQERIDEMNMTEELANVQNLEQLRDKAVEARDQMIADELQPLVKEYKDYKNNTDARLDDDDYADKLEQKRDAIQEREKELRDKYDEEYLSPFERAIEIDKKAAELEQGQDDGPSEEQRMQQRNQAFIDLQKEKKDEHPMFISSDPKGVNNFRNWAMNRAEEFGGLTKTYQWNQALKKWDERVENLRKQRRQKQVEDANNRDKEKSGDMPDYGDQNKITSEEKAGYRKDKEELAELAAETDQKHA